MDAEFIQYLCLPFPLQHQKQGGDRAVAAIGDDPFLHIDQILLIAHGIEVHSPKVITFTYELPSKVSLSAITQVFHCPIVSSYGTTETGFVMDSGLDGRYRQNEEYCRIDFVPLKGKERLGRIFVTTFGNPWAYIIRFDVGDLVVMDPDGTVGSIEGRVSNLTFTTKGEVVTTSMPKLLQAFSSAPASASALMTAGSVLNAAAYISGVLPSLSRAFTSAPAVISLDTS